MYTADALSCAPTPNQHWGRIFLWGNIGIGGWCYPASEGRLKEYKTAQEQDPTCTQVRQYCYEWMATQEVYFFWKMYYYKFKDNLSVCNDLLLYYNRIVVPQSLRKKMLQKIHSGHQAVERCRREYQLQSSGNRFVWAGPGSLSTGCGLFFKVSWGGEAILNYIHTGHCCTKGNLCSSRHSGNNLERQQPTVFITRVCSVFKCVWIPTYNKQSEIPAEQWTGWKDSANH